MGQPLTHLHPGSTTWLTCYRVQHVLGMFLHKNSGGVAIVSSQPMSERQRVAMRLVKDPDPVRWANVHQLEATPKGLGPEWERCPVRKR